MKEGRPRPDPERLGGLAWARRSGGRLTRAERRHLLSEIAKGQAENLIGRAKLALGRLPDGASGVDAPAFEPPDSALAREAEEACAEQLEPVPGRDFTLGGADRVLACTSAAAVARERGEEMADAICVHTTAGIRVDRDGPLGCYVQWGAMVDGVGLRLWDIAPANREETLRRHPREPGFKREFSATIRAEARTVPGGRFHQLVRCGFPLAARLAPFDP